ncbi:acyl-CoA thioesterase [Xanthomonas citri pv. durantae]|uniref:Acyl-CoA thioesterase n=1 Tax=Xanthomonas citri pv. durantae TaxID=487862 RepID=A0A9X6GJ12_XANCI|nr:thioesterase family protein [Xanthomonas citri]QRD56567.1 acyl-CoA thioesterase [Xanthomonas citri pv. citri]UVG57000.1 acyl-CoA thioesterase [Xanthomonas citri pv. durantae]CEH50845.1 Thioesterase superfamily protein [Xanthomonas citri pv. citri]CEH94240.1 Thioesterase superfamily protein [Xanthomonas citri pv. citri]
MRQFRYERLLQWSECDPAGIIFFPHYARWMVEGVNLLFLALGIDPNGTTDTGAQRGLPSTGFTTQFHAPAKLHDQLVHEISVTRIGSKSLAFRHRFLRDGQCLADAEEVRVWAESDANGLRTVPIPDEVKALLESDALLTHPLVRSPDAASPLSQ